MGAGASTITDGSASEAKTENPDSEEFAHLKRKYTESLQKGESKHEVFNKLSSQVQKSVGPDGMAKFSRAYTDRGSLQIRPQDNSKAKENLDLAVRNTSRSDRTMLARQASDPMALRNIDGETAEAGGGEKGAAHRRRNIFNKGVTVNQLKQNLIKSLKTSNYAPKDARKEAVRPMIQRALADFFFLGNEMLDKMQFVIDTMKEETIEPGDYLMKQGEDGSKMYIVEEGSLDVTIDGKHRRVMGKGDKVGELSLLYNAPRSASVQAKTKCVLWTLQRDEFRQMQALASSASLVQRSTWLHEVPCLKGLDHMDLCKVATSLQPTTYYPGDILLREGEVSDKCILVEEGLLEVTAEGMNTKEEVETKFGVKRPKAKSRKQSEAEAKKSPGIAGSGAAASDSSRGSGSGGGSSGTPLGGPPPTKSRAPPTAPRLSLAGATALSRQNESMEVPDTARQEVVLYQDGCFLGLGVLLAAGGFEGGWEWNAGKKGAVCPVTVKARGQVKCSYITVREFENMLGNISQTINKEVDGFMPRLRQKNSVGDIDKDELEAITYKLEDLEETAFLGRGSFGRVTLVKWKAGKAPVVKSKSNKIPDNYAMKALAKKAVVEGGQLNHVKDEKKMLTMMHHPFILRLYTTFQTPDQIFFLTEAIGGGELWSIIYEGMSGEGVDGLPVSHGRFYSAIVVEALGYMHEKGVAYRDLKPENLMVDGDGYLRVIDLGFAKKIPFMVEVDGEIQVHPRSYTMCGTPEYLAPEFIFNTGHDHSVDYWALGVLTYEMVVAHTPFVPPGNEPDMTQLFTNIACVKRKGVPFPRDFDQRAGGNRDCRDLVKRLLHHEPSQRLGNLAGKVADIKNHPYFSSVNWDDLRNKVNPGPWKPPSGFANLGSVDEEKSPVPKFSGDQSQFEGF